MISFETPNIVDTENEKQKVDWKWKTFSFQDGVLYLTSAAKKLSFKQKRVVFDDVRSFMIEKPKKLHRHRWHCLCS